MHPLTNLRPSMAVVERHSDIIIPWLPVEMTDVWSLVSATIAHIPADCAAGISRESLPDKRLPDGGSVGQDNRTGRRPSHGHVHYSLRATKVILDQQAHLKGTLTVVSVRRTSLADERRAVTEVPIDIQRWLAAALMHEADGLSGRRCIIIRLKRRDGLWHHGQNRLACDPSARVEGIDRYLILPCRREDDLRLSQFKATAVS